MGTASQDFLEAVHGICRALATHNLAGEMVRVTVTPRVWAVLAVPISRMLVAGTGDVDEHNERHIQAPILLSIDGARVWVEQEKE